MSEKPLEGEVECLTLYGKKRLLPKSRLAFRPGAYGLIYHDGKILFTLGVLSGKLCLPGGGIDPGEPMLDALRREIREETGLEVEVGAFVGVWDHLAYYDPLDAAWHTIQLCWACRPLDPDAPLNDGDPEEGKPAWVDIASLRPEDCGSITWEIVCDYLLRFPNVDQAWTLAREYIIRNRGGRFG